MASFSSSTESVPFPVWAITAVPFAALLWLMPTFHLSVSLSLCPCVSLLESLLSYVHQILHISILSGHLRAVCLRQKKRFPPGLRISVHSKLRIEGRGEFQYFNVRFPLSSSVCISSLKTKEGLPRSRDTQNNSSPRRPTRRTLPIFFFSFLKHHTAEEPATPSAV